MNDNFLETSQQRTIQESKIIFEKTFLTSYNDKSFFNCKNEIINHLNILVLKVKRIELKIDDLREQFQIQKVINENQKTEFNTRNEIRFHVSSVINSKLLWCEKISQCERFFLFEAKFNNGYTYQIEAKIYE